MSTETKESQEIIFRRVKKCFHDVPTFDRAIAPALRSVIADAHSVEFGKKTVARAAKRYFYVDELKQKGETTLAAQIELVLEVCYTAILADRTEFEHLQYKNVEQLKQAYAGFEEFSSADRAELELLLAFRNAVKIALVIIPAHRNKARLLKIGGRLEGSKKEYITGSGQSIEVSRRVRIYEQEGGEVAETRPPRQRKSKNSDEASGNPAPKRVRKNAKVTTSLVTAPGVMDALVTDSEDSGSEEELEHDFNKYVTPSFPIAQVSTATAASKPKEALPTSKALIGGMGQMTAARSFGDLLLAAQTHIPFARSAQPAPAPEVYIDPLAPYVTPTATALPMAVPVNSSFAAMLANSTVGATIPGSLPLLSSFASVPLSLSASAQGQAEAPMYRECSLGLYTAMDLIIDAAGLERDFQGR